MHLQKYRRFNYPSISCHCAHASKTVYKSIHVHTHRVIYWVFDRMSMRVWLDVNVFIYIETPVPSS